MDTASHMDQLDYGASNLKNLLLIFPLLVLIGCTTRVDMQTAAELDGAEIVPRVPTSTAIRTFEKYCHQTRANPGRVVAALKRDGYKLLVTDRRENFFGYAHATRPMVGVIDNPGEPGCMTFVKRDPALAKAFNGFVKARHRSAQRVSVRDLDTVWVVQGSPGLVFARDVDGTDELMMLLVK